MRGYSPEFLAKLRHAYEQTERPLRLMAKDFLIGQRTLYRIAHREGWTRMPRGLPPAMRMLEEASALLSAPNDACANPVLPSGEDPPPRSPSLSLSRSTLPREREREETALAEKGEPQAATASAAERIAELVQKELAAAEVMRAQLRAGDCAPIDAERMARTLSTLTQTLQTLQRLRAGETRRSNDDDIPRDINEFRRELARRIDAFVASRTGGADAGGDPGAMVDRSRP